MNLTIQPHRVFFRFLVGISCLSFVTAVSALDSNRTLTQYVHDRWGADKGFLGGAIYAISQSDDGFLWIGTERGLVRFDGSTFTLIQRPLENGPATGPVRGLVADAVGNLWIRLDGPHLLRYREGAFEDAVARFGLQEIAFTAMARDSKGELLLWGLRNRTLRFRDGKFDSLGTPEDTSGTVISAAETSDRTIWMGTRDAGLLHVEQSRIFKASKQGDNRSVNALLPVKSGRLWIGTDSGMEFWDGNALTEPLRSALKQVQILALVEDQQGNLWAGTDHGLVRVTPSMALSYDLVNRKLNAAVTAVYEDHDGDIWYGGLQGIERLRDGMFTTYSTAEGLPAQSNGPVYVDAQGRTWFAPLAGGLYWLKDGRVEPITADGIDKDVVYSISGGGGEVWIGRQRGGLAMLTPARTKFQLRTYTVVDGLAQNSVFSVHRNRDGTVWAGTVNAGVSRLRDGAFTNYSTVDGLASNTVNSIAEGYDGKMWFATPGGLACFADGRWTNSTMLDGLPSSNVRSIFEDSKHILWIGTSGGLSVRDAGRLEVLRDLPESLREQIFGIAEDRSGSLWITTSDHVLQADRERLLQGTLDESSVQSYGIADGLPGVEGVRRDRSVLADPAGRIWMSLNRGLAVADPKLATGYTAPVHARIESTSPAISKRNISDALTFPAGVRNVTLTYASTSLSNPERIRFRYKLEEAGQGWSDIVSAGHVIYTDLGPGKYQFRVVASSSNGLWNGPETIVPFVMEPALWQTNWFRGLCVLALMVVIAMIYRLRMYQLTRQLNVRFQERLAERTHIAQELHDTLLQGFMSASMQLDVAEDQLPDDSPAKPLLGRILQLMRQVNEEGRNAVRGLRTGGNDSQSLDLAFSRMRGELGIGHEVNYRVVVHSVARPLRPLIRDEVYRIGREAVFNAFLHARANTIEIELEYASRYLRMLVRDDGCGIDPHVLQTGREGHWGLAGMRKRSEGIDAILRLRSRISAGTEVELIVPGAVAFENQANGALSQLLPWLRRERFEPAGSGVRRRGRQ